MSHVEVAAATEPLGARGGIHVADLGLARSDTGSHEMNPRHAEISVEKSDAAVRATAASQATCTTCIPTFETNPIVAALAVSFARAGPMNVIATSARIVVALRLAMVG